MNKDQLISAIGDIDESYIAEAHKNIHIKKHTLRPFDIAAAAMLCIAAPLPFGVAAGSETAYQALYTIAPPVAQTFKPVQRSCTDQGIRIEVISADISDGKASFCLSVQDMEADRIDETIDLYDSYFIHMPFDSVGHCSFSEFDPETKTAYFVVHIERMDGKAIKSGKTTFSVSQLLTHKKKTERYIDEIGLGDLPEISDTFHPDNINGWSDMESDEAHSTNCIKPSDTPLFYAADSAAVTGYGLVDGKLHIQMKYENRHETDNHGFISLMDSNGEQTYCRGVHFGEYEEYIFDVSPEELPQYRLFGEFVTAPPCINGNWSVTFKFED